LSTPSARTSGAIRANFDLRAAAQIALQLAGQQFNPIAQQDIAHLLRIDFH